MRFPTARQSVSVWGGIEAGGTKFVCVVGSGPDAIRDEVRFPTTTPDETLTQAIAFFQWYQKQYGFLQSIGIGSFGPVDLHTTSPTFGYITSTPKLGWAHTDIAGRLSRALGVPVHFDTDVNAAAIGEHRWGAAQGLDTFPLIRRKVQTLINGYVNDPAILDEIEDYIVPSALGNRSGVLGALALAQQAE